MPQNNRRKKQHKKLQDNNNNNNILNKNQNENSKSKESSKESKLYEIKESQLMGRYLEASRDLESGQILIEEMPLAVGPSTDSDPVCLGCYQPIDISEAYFTCLECQWPLCSLTCPGLYQENGHSTWECALFKKNKTANTLKNLGKNYLRFIYEVIMPLRCLLLKIEIPEKWEKLNKMESHNDIRRKIPSLWKRNQEVIIERIRNFWNIKLWTENEIHTICGILEVNCFEIGQNGSKARALYPVAYLIAHDCVPNTSHVDYPKSHMMSIRTTMPIKCGYPITISYAYTFQGTLKRREHLQEGKFFWCQCSRCADPTELGTFSSAMQCPKCCIGKILSSNPLDQKASWNCQSCDYSVGYHSMFLLLEKIFKELDSLDPHDIPGQEQFLEKYQNVLYENHYLCISAKYSLCQLFGRSEGYIINDLTEDLLKRKEQYCRDVLRISDILEPGLTRLRGVIMYELHAPIMIQATRLFEKKKILKKELCIRLREVVSLLKNSEKILLMEPEGSSEHSMAIAAGDALKRIGTF